MIVGYILYSETLTRLIIIILSVLDLFYCSGLTVHVEERYLIKCRKYHALLYYFLNPNQYTNSGSGVSQLIATVAVKIKVERYQATWYC